MNNPESVGFVPFVNTRTCMMQGPLLLHLSAPAFSANSTFVHAKIFFHRVDHCKEYDKCGPCRIGTNTPHLSGQCTDH